MTETTVSVSLWSVSPSQQPSEARRLFAAGVHRFHWDYADGSISPAGGFTPERAQALSPADALHEAHLMQRDPRPFLREWTSFCDTIAVQAVGPHWHEAGRMIQDLGARPVLAITDAEELAAVPTGWGVLVMSVSPGHAGSTFDESSYELVARAAETHDHVGVDGSVTPERALRLRMAGATALVSGTSLTEAAEPANWLETALAPL